jgi:hypothetical protein
MRLSPSQIISFPPSTFIFSYLDGLDLHHLGRLDDGGHDRLAIDLSVLAAQQQAALVRLALHGDRPADGDAHLLGVLLGGLAVSVLHLHHLEDGLARLAVAALGTRQAAAGLLHALVAVRVLGLPLGLDLGPLGLGEEKEERRKKRG